jgi:hypothetical protein
MYNSEPTLLDISTAARAARDASSDPSVANSILVGNVLTIVLLG